MDSVINPTNITIFKHILSLFAQKKEMPAMTDYKKIRQLSDKPV